MGNEPMRLEEFDYASFLVLIGTGMLAVGYARACLGNWEEDER
jgi:hypothetical protein